MHLFKVLALTLFLSLVIGCSQNSAPNPTTTPVEKSPLPSPSISPGSLPTPTPTPTVTSAPETGASESSGKVSGTMKSSDRTLTAVDGVAIHDLNPFKKETVNLYLTSEPIPDSVRQEMDEAAAQGSSSASITRPLYAHFEPQDKPVGKISLSFEPDLEPDKLLSVRTWSVQIGQTQAPTSKSFGNREESLKEMEEGVSVFEVDKDAGTFTFKSDYWSWDLDAEVPLYWVKPK